MSELILDRRWRLQQTPAFLEPVTERERSIPWVIAFVLVASAAVVLISGLAVIPVAIAMLMNGHSFNGVLAMLQGAPLPGSALSRHNYLVAMAGLGLFPAALAVLGLAVLFYRRTMRSFVTTARRFRWRIVLLGFAISLAILGGALGLQQAFSKEALHPPVLTAISGADLAFYVASAMVFLFLAAWAEEAVFRGWLLQQTSAFTRSAPILLAVNGVLFALAHGDVDPGALFVRAVMGASWAWFALRLGGVEFSVGAHFANNILIALFIEPVTLAASIHEKADLTGGLIQLAIVGASVAAVELLIRSGKLEHSLTKH